MSILDFGKFNIDNALTQNKTLFGNYSNTNKGYEDSKTTDFNNMIDKINSKSKTLEPENKINTTDKCVVDKKGKSVGVDKTLVKSTNKSDKTKINVVDSKSSNYLPQQSNLNLKTSSNESEVNISEANISVSETEGSLINEDLVKELESLLNTYRDMDITSESDETEAEIDLKLVDTDLVENIDIKEDLSEVTDNFENIEDDDTQNYTSESIINANETDILENVSVNVQDVIVKDDFINYSDEINSNEIDVSLDLKDDVNVSANLISDTKTTSKTSENSDKLTNDFKEILNNTDDNQVNNADKKDTIVLKNNSDTKLSKDEQDINYDNQDLQEVINLDETVEVSETVKNAAVKINVNKNTNKSALDDIKISKKDLEDLKVKIEEVSYEETSNSGEFQSNQQTAQESLIKLSIDGIDNLSKMHKTEELSTNFAKALNQTNTKELTQENIVSQIYSKLQNIHQGSKMVMTLNPESLGKVQVELVNSKTGLIAQMSVTNNAVKDILSKDLDGLRAALNSQGITVDSINIKLDETMNDSGKNDYLDQEKNKDGKEQGFSKNKKDENEKQEQRKLFENLFENISEENIKE